MTKSLKIPRSIAFANQNGCCYYCSQPMWIRNPLEILSKYNITPRQTKYLQCTGEHLIAHQDGGTSVQCNIVAACRFCNLGRHKIKVAPNPEEYMRYVQRQMSQGRWHGFKVK